MNTTMLNLIRPLLLISLTLLPWGVAQAQTSTTPFALTATQKKRAGIITQPLPSVNQHTTTASNNLNALQLPGTITIPLDAQEIISAPSSGVIQNILTLPAQTVEAGQPLIQLYSQQILQWQRDFLNATTQAQLSSKKLERDRALFNEGIIAQNRLQETENTATQSRVIANENSQMLRLAGMSPDAIRTLQTRQALSPIITITARTAGTLIQYTASPGQYVEAGTPIGKLVRQEKGLWVELRATHAQAAQIRKGDRITFSRCAEEAKVTAITPQVDADNQTVLIRGALLRPSTCFVPNQYISATVYTLPSTDVSWSVPASAAISQGNTAFIFIETEQGFQATPIEVLTHNRDTLSIRPVGSSFPANAKVAISGTAALKGRWLGIGSEDEPSAEGNQ